MAVTVGQCAGKACGEAPAEEQLKARSRRPHHVSVSGVLCSCTALNRQARPAPPLCFLTASHSLSPCGLPEPPPWLPSGSSSGRDHWLSDRPSLPLRCDCAWQILLSSLTILSSALCAAGSLGESSSHSRMAPSRSPTMLCP